MATKTLGTSATTTLTALGAFNPSPIQADVATINNGILDDLNVAHPIASQIGTGGFVRQGILYVPNRGQLIVLPGDWVAIDPNGWPILVSKNSIAGSGWSHS